MNEREEYLTIFAPSAGEVMAQFKARRLGEQGYSITGKIGRHRLALVGDGPDAEALPGSGMIAATFSRKVPA